MTVMYRFKLKGETGVRICLHVKVFSLCTSTIKIVLVQTIFVPVQRQFVPEFLKDNIKILVSLAAALYSVALITTRIILIH